MKSFAALLILFCCMHFYAGAQTNTDYDSLLAKKLNADDYGMKKYILVILKTGTASVTDKARRDSIFKGHMQNMQRLATQNKLVLAGPFYDNDQKYEGIFVLNADNMEEAKKMLETDPAVHADLLQAELYAWYGSAALQELNDLHNKIEKIHF